MFSGDGPRNTSIAIGITSIQFIAIVQLHGGIIGNSGRRTPFEDFLAQYMRRYPCIQPARTICFCAAFHNGSWVSAFSNSLAV